MSVEEAVKAYPVFPSGSIDYLTLAERLWSRRVFANARMLMANYRVKDGKLACRKCGSTFELNMKMLGQRLRKHLNSFRCIIGAKYDLHPVDKAELARVREAFMSCPTPESRDKCLCGCGMYVKYGSSYVPEHYMKTREFREAKRAQWRNPEFRKKIMDAKEKSVKMQVHREKQRQRRELILRRIREGVATVDIAREMGYTNINSVHTMLHRIKVREGQVR